MSKGVQSRGEEVRGFLLRSIAEQQTDPVALAVGQFGITRQAVGKHIAQLRQQKAIEVTGTHRKPVYRLAVIQKVTGSYPIRAGLAEHDVWDDLVKPCLQALPRNICYRETFQAYGIMLSPKCSIMPSITPAVIRSRF